MQGKRQKVGRGVPNLMKIAHPGVHGKSRIGDFTSPTKAPLVIPRVKATATKPPAKAGAAAKAATVSKPSGAPKNMSAEWRKTQKHFLKRPGNLICSRSSCGKRYDPSGGWGDYTITIKKMGDKMVQEKEPTGSCCEMCDVCRTRGIEMKC